MLNHFEELCNLCAVSGDEGAVRDYVCRALEETPQFRGRSTRWEICWWRKRAHSVLRIT